MKPVLLDTGVIVALLDRSEKFHQSCADVVRDLEPPLVTCEAVIENVFAGIFQIPFQLSRDADGVKQRLRKYRDRKIDLADASLIRLADDFETADILILDKDFEIYRWERTSPSKSF